MDQAWRDMVDAIVTVEDKQRNSVLTPHGLQVPEVTEAGVKLTLFFPHAMLQQWPEVMGYYKWDEVELRDMVEKMSKVGDRLEHFAKETR